MAVLYSVIRSTAAGAREAHQSHAVLRTQRGDMGTDEAAERTCGETDDGVWRLQCSSSNIRSVFNFVFFWSAWVKWTHSWSFICPTQADDVRQKQTLHTCTNSEGVHVWHVEQQERLSEQRLVIQWRSVVSISHLVPHQLDQCHRCTCVREVCKIRQVYDTVISTKYAVYVNLVMFVVDQDFCRYFAVFGTSEWISALILWPFNLLGTSPKEMKVCSG